MQECSSNISTVWNDVFKKIRRRFHLGCHPGNRHADICIHASDPGKLLCGIAHVRKSEEISHRDRAGTKTDHSPIVGLLRAHVVRHHDARRSRHVLGDDVGVAVQKSGEAPRQQPCISVVAATCGMTDEEAYVFSLVAFSRRLTLCT